MRISSLSATPRILRGAGVAATAVAVAVGMTPARAQHAAATAKRECLPLGGLLVGDTIRRRVGDRDEVTEFLGHDVYRVTRCDLKDRFMSSMTVEGVDDPDGQLVLAPETIVDRKKIRSLDYGDPRDPRWARAWRLARALIAKSILHPTPGVAKPDPDFDSTTATGASLRFGGPVAFAAAGGACQEGGHGDLGEIWDDHRYSWRWNSTSFGSNYKIRDALENGAEAWNTTHTNCDLSDITTITPDYKGSTGHHAGVSDTVSTVDKGNIESFGCPGTLACTQNTYDNDGFVETDMRFSNAVKWSTKGAANAYDYRSIATHEFGHAIGLSDLHDDPNLTMYYAVKTGSTSAATLGLGDVRGLRDLYP